MFKLLLDRILGIVLILSKVTFSLMHVEQITVGGEK